MYSHFDLSKPSVTKKKQKRNGSSRRPAQNSKRAKCFKYAKTIIRKVFVNNAVPKNTIWCTLEKTLVFFSYPETLKNPIFFVGMSHSSEKLEKRFFGSQNFFQTINIKKVKRAPLIRLIFFSISRTVPVLFGLEPMYPRYAWPC